MTIVYRWAENQTRSTAGAGGRIGSPPGRRDRRDRRRRLRRSRPRPQPRRSPSSSPSRRPGQARPCRKPRAAGRQPDRHQFFRRELAAKRLELLRELVPAATRVAVLVNPANAANTETTLRDVEPAARAMGLQIQVFNASTSREIDAAFATIVRERPDALFVGWRSASSTAGVSNWPIWRRATRSLRFYSASRICRSRRADELRNATLRTRIVRSASMPAASSRARSPRTCRSCRRPNSSWSSTPDRPACSASTVPPTLLARADEVIE